MKCNKFLEQIGYEELTEKEPKLAVEYFLRVVPELDLRATMAGQSRSKKGEDFKDFNQFINKVVEEARLMDRVANHGGSKLSAADIENYNLQGARLVCDDPPPLAPNKMGASKKNMRKNKQTLNGLSQGSSSDANTDEAKPSKRFGKRGKRDIEAPPCLNSKCEKKQWLKDYTFTSEEEKKRLREDIFARKKAKK